MYIYNNRLVFTNRENVSHVQFNKKSEHEGLTFRCLFGKHLCSGISFFNSYLYCDELDAFVFYATPEYIISEFHKKRGCNIVNVDILEYMSDNYIKLLRDRGKVGGIFDRLKESIKPYDLDEFLLMKNI